MLGDRLGAKFQPRSHRRPQPGDHQPLQETSPCTSHVRASSDYESVQEITQDTTQEDDIFHCKSEQPKEEETFPDTSQEICSIEDLPKQNINPSPISQENVQETKTIQQTPSKTQETSSGETHEQYLANSQKTIQETLKDDPEKTQEKTSQTSTKSPVSHDQDCSYFITSL